MIVVMKAQASKEEIQHVVDTIESMNLKSHPIYGTERTVVAAVGSKRSASMIEKLEALDGVEKVVPILASYKIASVEVQHAPTVVTVGPLTIGGGRVGVVAGPCSVENEAQILAIADRVKAAGAGGLRGGAFKPRTSPYSFQGLKEDGLKLLAAARDKTGLAIVTEVMAPHNVELVARYADVMQIGARNMQNYDLLSEVGMCGKPVLLKRGPCATAEEFLLAAEYILDKGNRNVILCERGIRTFEDHTRFTLPLSIVPYLREKTHLPIVVDPSHGTGRASLVNAMSRAAVAAGADGLILEVHTDPEKSWSDGAQTIDFNTFDQLLHDCRRVAAAVDRTLP